MGDINSFTLKSGGKPCWFDCHRRFLPINHSFRRDQCSFKKLVVENSLPPQEYSGIDVINQVNQLQKVTFGLKSSKQKQPRKRNTARSRFYYSIPSYSLSH